MFVTTVYAVLLLAFVPYRIRGDCLPGSKAKPSPVNIITSKTIPANATSPLTLVIGAFQFIKVMNTGKTIEVYVNEKIDHTHVTGGVLCNKIYKFYKGVFLINRNPNGRSGSAVNGVGAPVEAISVFFNVEYGSFKNAVTKPDGLVQLSALVDVRSLPKNPLFVPTQIFLLSSGALKKPGSSTKFPAFLFFPWIFEAIPNTVYYAYRGTYTDLDTEKKYASAINIVQSFRQYLSPKQFAAFEKVLGNDDQPINATLPLYSSKGTTVYKAKGFKPRLTFL